MERRRGIGLYNGQSIDPVKECSISLINALLLDESLKVWDLAIGTAFRPLKGYALSLSGCYYNTVRVWDISTGSMVSVWEGHSGTVYCCRLFVDGTKAIHDQKRWRVLNGHASCQQEEEL